MRRGCVAFIALALIGGLLVGCGRIGFEQREPWRAQAEEACLASKHVTPTAYMSRVSEIDGPGSCGISYPFRLTALAGGTVGLTNKVTLGCPIIPQIDGWVLGTVQPAAELYFGTQVAEIRAGTYSCRGRNNQAGAKLSEHSFGNAMDVMSFRFADGRSLSVEKGWKGAPEEQEFLREVFVGACRHFTTVLAPGSDIYHYNHLHLDLARHDPRGVRHICKPLIKFEPRLDPDRPVAAQAPPRPRPAVRPESAEPLDIDEDPDPYAASTRPGPGAPRIVTAAPQPSPVYTAPRPPPPMREATPAYLQSSPARPLQTAGTRPGAGAPLVLQPQLWSGTTPH